jgi:hypothetical protein
MSDILPMRRATRQRLAVGTLIVVLVSLLHLVSVNLGIFGSLWPIPLLWAACGWSGLGANAGTAVLLFGLGLWFDVLTGSNFGTWAMIGLGTHIVMLLASRFLGLGSVSNVVNCALSGFFMLCVMILLSLIQNTGMNLAGMMTPLITTISLYFFVGKWFELSEDEI